MLYESFVRQTERKRVTQLPSLQIVLESWQGFSCMLVLTCLSTVALRDYLSLSVLFFFLEAIWFGGILLILFFTVYLGLVYFANATLCKGTIRIGKSAPLFSCTERGYVKHLIGCSIVPFCYVFNAVNLPEEIITNSLYPVFGSLDQMRFPASMQRAKNDRHNSELEQ